MRAKHYLVIGLLLIAPICSAADLHYTLLEQPPRALPKKVVVIPADIVVKELSAGGVAEKVPEWTAEAEKVVTDAIFAHAKTRSDIEIVPLPQLTEEEQELLDDYLASYLVVGMNAQIMTQMGGSAWQHKRDRFDYTLGSGLRFLKEKTGADAALIAVGEDVVSSGGRKAAFILAAAVLGVAIPMGHSVISLGMLDLDNGDILWMHYDASGVIAFRDVEATNEMVAGILKEYPGLPGQQPAVATAKASQENVAVSFDAP